MDRTHSMEWLQSSSKYTTFRINKLRKSIDLHVLETYLNQQIKQLNVTKIPKVYFLRPDCLVVCQWDINEEVVASGREVIVDALCAAAVLRGAHVFAPGVMGLPTDVKINDNVSVYGDLEGKCKRGLKVPFEGRKLFVGNGYLKQKRYELFDDKTKPSGIAVQITMPTSKLPVLNENIYPKGDVLLQNLPSIICGWVLNAQPNEYILDMCAAPGNKTTHLAEMSNDQAYIIAIDKTEVKVENIKSICSNHGISCVHAFVYDSTKCHSPTSESIFNGPPFPENSFDKILLDAPCSGLGQRPQLKNNVTPKMLESYKFVQRKLMDAAVKLLKVGGRLVYSTCTTTIDENEGMVSWTLQKFPQLELVAAEPLLGGPGCLDSGLTTEQRLMLQRFGPEDDVLREVKDIYKDTIGFFIANFKKSY